MSTSLTASESTKGAIEALKEQRLGRLAELAKNEPPVPDGHIRLTFLEVDRQFKATEELSRRRLSDTATKGTATPDKKIRVILGDRHYGPAHKLFLDLHHLIIVNNPPPTGWEDDQTLPIVLAERRQLLFEELKRDTVDVPLVPMHLRLTSDDMPIMGIKGELGHQNRFSVADIKRNLGYLYVEDDADDEEKGGD